MGVRAGVGRGLAAMLVLATMACGGGGSRSNNPMAPQGPQTTIVIQEAFPGLPPDRATFRNFSIGDTGRMDVEVRWTLASNDLDVYVTTSSCDDLDMLFGGGCTIVGSDTGFTMPARFSASVTPAPHRIWLLNFGPGPDSGTVLITLTH